MNPYPGIFGGGVSRGSLGLGVDQFSASIPMPGGAKAAGLGVPGLGGSGLILLGPIAVLTPGVATAGVLNFNNPTNADLIVRRLTLEYYVTASGVMNTYGGSVVQAILVGGIPVIFGVRGIPMSTFLSSNTDWPAMEFVLKANTGVLVTILNGPIAASFDGACWCTPG